MLTTRSLKFSYGKQRQFAFPDITLPPGEHCLILGESGSGKTTLLHLIGGLLKPNAGAIFLDKEEVTALHGAELDRFRGRHIGFVFQKHHLISALTVYENIRLAGFLTGTDLPEGKIDNVLRMLDLADKKQSRTSELSQGQAQRAAIGRAIVNGPRLIVADEPTSALDDANCLRVIALLLEVASNTGASLIIATHDDRLKKQISKHIPI